VDYPRDLVEIVVVDNGSTDASGAVAEACGAVVCFEPRPGPYAARNLGAASAHGAVLAFTDADCRVHPGWARALVNALETHDAVCGLSLGAAGGAISQLVQNRYESNLRERVSAADPLPVFDTRNAAVSRSVFENIGGFDDRLEDLADDIFGIQVTLRGGRLGFVEDMVVEHIHPESLKGVWRRQVRHGRFIPLVRASYGNSVTKSFPGIDNHAWMYEPGLLRRMGSVLMLVLAVTETATSGVMTKLFPLLGLRRLSEIAFDLYCRGGTVWGMSEIGVKGIIHPER
jgi:glycosyltransferase involved in cell wall biosynthesis